MSEHVQALTITNDTTGQVIVSQCTPVRFHNGTGAAQSYSVAGGIGTGCTNLWNMKYASLASNTYGPGSISITEEPIDPFISDTLVFTPSADITGHQSEIGGDWDEVNLTIRENAGGQGVQCGTANPSLDAKALNDRTPPQAAYKATITLHSTDTTNNHQIGVMIHSSNTADTFYCVRYVGSAHIIELARFDNPGGHHQLGSVAFNLDNSHTQSVTIAISWKAGVLEWFVAGVSQGTVNDNTYPGAGLVGLMDHVNVLTDNTYMAALTCVTI